MPTSYAGGANRAATLDEVDGKLAALIGLRSLDHTRQGCGSSARLQPQRRRQDLGADYRLRVGARLVLSQEFAASPRDRVSVARRERQDLQPASGKFQCGGPARCEVSVPPPLAAAHRAHKDLFIGHHHPDDHRSLGVFLGPDRDFPEIAQFTQGVRIELRYCLSPLLRRSSIAKVGRATEAAASPALEYGADLSITVARASTRRTFLRCISAKHP